LNRTGSNQSLRAWGKADTVASRGLVDLEFSDAHSSMHPKPHQPTDAAKAKRQVDENVECPGGMSNLNCNAATVARRWNSTLWREYLPVSSTLTNH